MRGRMALGALGVLAGLYGAWLVLSRGHDLVNLVEWLVVGVVAHDALLAAVTLVAGALLVRLVPTVLCVVVASVLRSRRR